MNVNHIFNLRNLAVTLALLFALPVFGQQKMSEKEADGLKGKVKSVTTVRQKIESKNYPDNSLKTLRDKIEMYDENGDPTKSVDYEYNSKNIYTFIDGDLTSKYSQIVKAPQNEGLFSSDRKQKQKPTQTKDERYLLKYKYKFDDKGRRSEMLMYGNTGILVGKIKSKYDDKGVLVEELRYTESGDLNEQYIYSYDTTGNLIESKLILHRPIKNLISFLKYSNYKLDAQGNWIERTETSSEEYEDKELKTVYKNSRKIEYYK